MMRELKSVQTKIGMLSMYAIWRAFQTKNVWKSTPNLVSAVVREHPMIYSSSTTPLRPRLP